MTKIELKSFRKKEEEEEALFLASSVGADDGGAGDDSDDDAGVTHDDAQHTRLLNDVMKLNKKKRNEAKRAVRTSLGGAAGGVDTSHLLSLLEVPKLKHSASKLKTLSTPTEKITARKAKRAAGYEDVMIESEKWAPIVHRQRRADTLSFPLHPPDLRPIEVQKAEEREWKPRNKLEEDVYGLLQGAKLVGKKVETEEEQAIKRAMSLQEIREKNRELWRQRELRRRYEEKAMRQNKSKSRKHHRILRRERLKKQRAQLEELQRKDPEAALGVLEELERARIEERMSLRHKKSKWAHLQGPRAQRDKQMMAALKENQRIHRELITKMAKDGDSDDDEDSTKKVEEMLKEREIAIEEGTYDPLNPWTNSLKQLPGGSTRGQEEEEEGQESFSKFVKFWDDYNKRKAVEKKIQEEMERRELEEESKALMRMEGEKDVDEEKKEEEEENEEEEKEYDKEEKEEEKEEDKEEKEEEESRKNKGTVGVKGQKKKCKNTKDKRAEKNDSEEIIKKTGIKKKNITKESSSEQSVKESVRPKKKGKREEKNISSKGKANIEENMSKGSHKENISTKEKGKKGMKSISGQDICSTTEGSSESNKANTSTKKNYKKEKKLKEKSTEGTSEKKLNTNTKKKGIKRKNSISSQDSTSNKEEGLEERSEGNTSAKKVKKRKSDEGKKSNSYSIKKLKKVKPNQGMSEENKIAKKGKKQKLKQNNTFIKGKGAKEKIKENSAMKKGKAVGKKKISNLDSTSPQNSKKNKRKKDQKSITTTDAEEAPNNIDDDAAASIDMLFDEAEEGLKTVVKRKLEKINALEAEEDQKWMQVKKRKKQPAKNETKTLPAEEFDFTVTDDAEKIDERLERAVPLNDDETSTEGKKGLEKAVSTLKKDAQNIRIEKNQPQAGKHYRNQSASDKESTKSTKNVNVDPTKFMQVNAKRLVTAMPDVIGDGGEEALDDDEEEEGQGDDDDPEAVIREAFADDYLIEEFNAEKAAAIQRDAPKTMSLALPGWGEWTGPNIVMSRKTRNKFRVKPPRNARKDANISNVIYNEKADLHANLRKAMVSDLPYPFKSVKDFEASVRAPVGRLFIPDAAHKRMTQPPIVTKLGTVIEPVSEESLLKMKNSWRGKRTEKKEEEKEKKGERKW